MKLEFWGARGTAPVSGRDKVAFGGNTACAAVRSNAGDFLIVDAGTGIRDLGIRLMAEADGGEMRLHILLTHFHLDHIIGLPFFAPLYSPRASITFYSNELWQPALDRLSKLMGGRYFPMDYSSLPSKKNYLRATDAPFEIGSIKISTCPLIHPGGSIAYKLAEEKTSIVFATDTETPTDGVDEQLVEFASGASCLIYDATFTPEEYAGGRMGWGHSTWLSATQAAQAAGAGRLCLSHWSPDYSDSKIREIVRLAREKFRRTFGARQGLEKNF